MDKKALVSPPARLAGALYLVVIASGVFGVGYVRGALIEPGDAAATTAAIAGSQLLWRLGLIAEIVMYAAYAGVTVILYAILKPVGIGLSRAAACLSLIGIATGAASVAFGAAPFAFAPGAPGLAGVDAGLGAVLLMAFLQFFTVGFSISMEFFGLYMILIGGLIAGSTIIPRILGLLMILGGLGHVVDNVLYFADLPPPGWIAPFLSRTALVAELALALWLLFAGVNGAKWRASPSK